LLSANVAILGVGSTDSLAADDLEAGNMAAEVVVAGNMAADGLHDVCEASLVLVARALVVRVVTLVVVAGQRAVVAV